MVGLPSGTDDFAELGRTLAVEGLAQRDTDGIGLREVHGHAHPGDGLEDEPMPANCCHEGQGDEPLDQAEFHEGVEDGRGVHKVNSRQKKRG